MVGDYVVDMNRPEKFFLAFFFILAGIFTASFYQFSPLFFLFFIVFLLAIFLWAFILEKKKMYFWLLLFLLYLFGIGFYQLNDYYQKKNSSLSLNNQGILTVEAIIDEEPEIKSETVFFKAKIIRGGKGRILIKTRNSLVSYGDLVLIAGEFQEPENYSDFNFRDYLSKDGIYSVVNYPQIKILAKNQGSWIKNLLFQIKKSFEEKIEKIFPEPEASFLKGLLFGEKASFSLEFRQKLQKSGTSHLIALSGYNVTVIIQSVLLLFLFLGLGRKLSFLFAAIFIIGFILMTGASPSVVRAGLMGILAILGQVFGRLYYSQNALFASLFLMTFFNPKILRFDPAFQLSFLATLGLIYLSPFYQKIFQARKESFLNWRENLAITFSAQSAVLPLLIIHFGYLSLVAPFTNVLLISLIPLTMLLGFLIISLSFLSLPLAFAFGWPLYFLLKYETLIINFFGSLPFSTLSLGKLKEFVFWLVLFFLLIFFLILKKKHYEF